MATFSGREALWSGVRLLRRKPSVILYWGLAYFVLGSAPQVLLLSAVLSSVLPEVGGAEAAPEAVSQLAGWMSLLQPVQIISSIVSSSVFYSAIIRAMLEPDNDRLGYLRFGSQELWIGIVTAVAMVLFGIASAVVFTPIVVMAVIALAAGSQPGAGAIMVIVVLGLAAFCVLSWLMLRLAFGLPLTFETRKFMLFESWPMTRGHAAKMLGVLLAAMIVATALFYLLVAIALAAVFGAGLLPPPGSPLWAEIFRPGVRLFAIIGVASIVSTFLSVACTVLIYAPVVDIYRQLRSQQPPTAA